MARKSLGFTVEIRPRVHPDVARGIKDIARERGVSSNYLLREVLNDFLTSQGVTPPENVQTATSRPER